MQCGKLPILEDKLRSAGLPAFGMEASNAGSSSEADGETFLYSEDEPRDHKIFVEGKLYVVGRFRAWKGKRCPWAKLPFDPAPDVYILCLPASETESAAKLVSLTRTRGFITSSSRFGELIQLDHGSYVLLAFEKAAMIQQVSALIEGPVVDDVEFDCVVDLTTVSGSRLAALGNLVWYCINGSDGNSFPLLATEHLFQATMIALLNAVPNNYLRRVSQSTSPAVPWRVKRAIEYMHANLSRSLEVSEIAREIGTSVRALQSGFKQFKGTTILTYLRTIRLEAARKTLLGNTTSPSISDVARSTGFTHMGRFAAAYRQAFGETPSETIKLR
ncbi:helix-turn-helix domain-containing protein [Agrobacterium sp. ST15.13.095]|nr:helix-turn-helix domain-containing protein [Agrobacterium sp. ST15.13.095]